MAAEEMKTIDSVSEQQKGLNKIETGITDKIKNKENKKAADETAKTVKNYLKEVKPAENIAEKTDEASTTTEAIAEDYTRLKEADVNRSVIDKHINPKQNTPDLHNLKNINKGSVNDLLKYFLKITDKKTIDIEEISDNTKEMKRLIEGMQKNSNLSFRTNLNTNLNNPKDNINQLDNLISTLENSKIDVKKLNIGVLDPSSKDTAKTAISSVSVAYALAEEFPENPEATQRVEKLKQLGLAPQKENDLSDRIRNRYPDSNDHDGRLTGLKSIQNFYSKEKNS